MVNVAAGDLGASAAKKYDCEAWLPGQGRYRELTSCSNTTDYQARRLRARYRPAGGGSPRPVHTLNGTAVAVGRTIIAIMENHQTPDGGVIDSGRADSLRRSPSPHRGKRRNRSLAASGRCFRNGPRPPINRA